MAPYIYPVMSPTPIYYQLDNYSQPPARVDSPIQGNDYLFSIMEPIVNNHADAEGSRYRGTEQQSRPPSEAPPPPSDFRFVVANKPEDFKDKEAMRQSRRHVMHDWLSKNRGNDARPSSSKRQRRNREDAPPPGITPNKRAPSRIFKREKPFLIPSITAGSSTASRFSTESDEYARATLPRRRRPSETSPLLHKNLSGRVQQAMQEAQQPLVQPREFPNDYDSADVNLIPYPSRRFGSNLNPFDTWPRFDRLEIDVEQLKYNCTNYFGSHAMSRYWVPTLLQGRHTFLSTICISSAYHDAMYRSYLKHVPESVERMRVREEVVQMINRSLDDPALRTSDCTIVAVLQLLHGEIISCNQNHIQIHKHAVTIMVNLRGGLGQLGLHGELALLITITMYTIAFLGEDLPEQQYMDYALARNTSTPLTTKRPENPANCPESGYSTIRPALQQNRRLFELLELTRLLTLNLVPPATGRDIFPNLPPVQHTLAGSKKPQDLHGQIIAMPPARNIAKRGKVDWVYESVRLTAILVSTALMHKVPLSEAAVLYTKELPETPLFNGHKRELPKAMHMQIRNALMRTDISHCWGHMIGGLLWIVLVAGAAANTSSTHETKSGHQPTEQAKVAKEEHEEARRWLTAITIRCSILLSFEYGDAVLETLKRMLEMQRVLRAGPQAPSPEPLAPVTSGPVAPSVTTRPSVSKGMADFLNDFEGR